MTTSRRFFSGDNLDQAVMQAARHHHLLPDQVAYRLIEKRHGFLKIRRGVVIEVDPEAPAKVEGAAVEGAAAPEEVRPPVPEPATAEAPAADEPVAHELEPEVPLPEKPLPERPAPRETTPKETRPKETRPKPVAPWHLAEEAQEAEELQEAEEAQEAEEVEPAPVTVEQETFEPETSTEEAAPDDDAEYGENEAEIEEEAELEEEAEEAEAEEETFELAEDLEEAAGDAVEQLLEFVNLEGLAIEIREGEDRLEVELSGEGQDRLLEERGAILLAIEHLVPRLLRGILGRSAPCRVDCGGFHEARERRLEDLALDAADEVRSRRRSQTMAPMSPEERRIVHMTLADDPDVGTESQGRGFFKRVTVSPIRHRRRGIAHFDD